MKILIVDDEELTRNGLIETIDWKNLGIFSVLQAEDGLIGLNIAKEEKPDIVLCDVRMPRMNGITMVEKLEKILPNSAFIFMSGYSDKEYLKAAIHLKAVNYVEKPLNPDEVVSSIKKARENVLQNIKIEKNELLYSRETFSKFAEALTHPHDEKKELLDSLCQELEIKITHNTYFSTFILKTNQVQLSESNIELFITTLEKFLAYMNMKVYYVCKELKYHVFHIVSNKNPSEQKLKQIGEFLCKNISFTTEFFVSIGESFRGIQKAYLSYESSMSVIRKSFFFETGSFLMPKDKYEHHQNQSCKYIADNLISSFSESILAKNKENCFKILDQLYSSLFERDDLLEYEAKELYYKFFMTLFDCRYQMKLTGEYQNENTIKMLEDCFCLATLHEKLESETKKLFETASSSESENSVIFLIKDYIHLHYTDENLSVRDISEQVFLSPAYVCTYFKNETGVTINQYITDFRMKKAKKLLKDPRNKIADISAKVGYSNGNYFSKSFKKYTGLSPSEYREKTLE
ncbi:MAG: response regulator [Clostridioides sp.]|jgi:two-component system response regulator YesN|nr:response regulator [Clostridioides sp.]